MRTGRASLAVLVAVLLTILPVATHAQVEQEPAGTVLTGRLSHIYNLLTYPVGQAGIDTIVNGLLVPGTNTLLLAGQGSYAVLGVNAQERTLSLIANGATVGVNTIIFVDSLSGPRWYGYAQDSGEILLVNSTNPSYTLTYYTATRTSPVSAFTESASGKTKLVAVDSEGYAYIFTAGEPYWLEIGPSAHAAALASLPYMSVQYASPVWSLDHKGTGNATDLALLKVNPTGLRYAGNITLDLYYHDRYNNTDLPATSGTFTQGNISIIATTYLLLSDTNGLVVYSASFTQGGPIYNLTLAPAGSYNLTIIYQRVYIDTVNHTKTVDWYTYKLHVNVPPSTTNNLGLLVAQYYVTGDYTLDQVASSLGAILPGPGTVVLPYLAVNLTKLDNTTIYEFPAKGSSHWLVFLPAPVSASRVEWYVIYKPAVKPQGWPANAEYLMVAGTSQETALLYLLDANLSPVWTGSGFYEDVYLASNPSTLPAVTPSLDQVYLGAESGYILKLEWLPSEERYVGANAYILDTAPVTSLSLDNSTGMLFASSSSGLIQLIDTASWTPLWRGIPGYYGVDTRLPGITVMGKAGSYIVGIAPGQGSVAVMYQPEMSLYPVMVSLNVTVTGLDGNTTSMAPPPGTEGTIYDNGVPVAMGEADNNGKLVFYLPAGNHTLNLTLPSLGWIEKNYTVTNGVTDTIRIGLRAYAVNAYTPSKSSDPKKSPGYYLVRGPKPGTLITASPYAYDAALGYVPTPLEVQETAGANGTAVLLLWDGVVYQVTGSLQGYTASTGFTSLHGPGTMNITMNPVLYKVTFNIYDNQTVAYGAPLYLPATASLVYAATGASVNLTIQGQGDYYYLPPGAYAVSVVASHYVPAQVSFNVPGQPVTLNVGLDPEVYQYSLEVYQVDPTPLDIANGPMSGAQVNITMVWPIPGMVHLTLYTGPDGTVATGLRYGIYRVIISHPYAESKAVSVYLGNNTKQIVNLDLRTSFVTLYFKDSQFTLYGVKNVTLTLSYQGSTWTGNYTVTTGNKSIISLTVPYGVYRITASAKYYQTYTETREIAEESLLETVYMDPAMATVRVQVAYSPMAGNLTEGPVQGALVQLKLREPAVPTGNISAVTGNDGIAVFYVRQGVYDIIVKSKYTVPLTDKSVEIVGDTLIPEPVMPATAALQVTVVDAETSILVPGITLTLTRIMPGVEKTVTITLPNGTLDTALPAGVYSVKVSYPGRYYEQETQVDLVGGTSQQVTFSLAPIKGGVSLQLYANQSTAVIGKYKIPLPRTGIAGANVTLIPYDSLLRAVSNNTITTTTGPDGRAELTDIRTGTYLLRITAPGYPEYQSLVQVSPEAVTTLTIIVDPYVAEVNLTVIDNGLSDIYVRNYTLTLNYYNGEPIGKSVLLPGPTRMTLPTGTYSIVISKDRYIPANLTLSVTGGESTQVTVNLTPVTVGVTFTVKVSGVQNITGAVAYGTLELYPVDWRLAVTPLTARVEGGVATATLRIGTYKAYLVNEALGTNISLGTVQVTPNTVNVELTAKPPTYNVEFNLMDADLVTKIYGTATIGLTYMGPFGSGTLTVSAVNGTGKAVLVPGNYSIAIDSDYYEPYRGEITVTGPRSFVLVLTPIRVQTTINLVDIDGNPVTVANVTITIVHKETGETVGAVLVQGKIVPLKGLRLGTHEIIIVPPENAPINTTRATLTVTSAGASPSTITALPRLFTLKIVLIDPVTGGPAGFPFTVQIQRSGNPASEYGLPITAQVKNGTLIVHVPYGLYTVTVRGGPNSFFQDPAPQTVMVNKDTELSITLEPKIFKGVITVTDDRNNPIQGALVIVKNAKGNIVASGTTDAAGRFTFNSVYGPYIVTAKANGYKEATLSMYLPTQSELTVSLQPTPATVLKRYSVLIIGMIGIIGVAAGLYLARGKILERLQEEEEYF